VKRLASILLASAIASAAATCTENDVQGSYGFELTGATTITGLPKSVSGVGRLDLGPDGKITGISSINFDGMYLGNPVTGAYEVKEDCTMTWRLQDDSGAWQHFAGTVEPGSASIEFHQTDPGATNTRGILEKTPPSCANALLLGRYVVSIAGRDTSYTDPGRISASGAAQADGAGNVIITWPQGQSAGIYSVDSDCRVELELGLAAGADSAAPATLRGVIVNGGNKIVAVQTGSERVAVARFVR
jgi:hypothetical protein